MFTFSLSGLVILALVPIVGFLGAKWLFSQNTAIENRRRAAARLAGKLQVYGLKRTPELLLDYSVGDYSGMANRIVQIAELFTDDAHVVAELDGAFDGILAAKLNTDAGRAYIAAKLADAAKETDPSAVTNAPAPQAVTQATATAAK